MTVAKFLRSAAWRLFVSQFAPNCGLFLRKIAVQNEHSYRGVYLFLTLTRNEILYERSLRSRAMEARKRMECSFKFNCQNPHAWSIRCRLRDTMSGLTELIRIGVKCFQWRIRSQIASPNARDQPRHPCPIRQSADHP